MSELNAFFSGADVWTLAVIAGMAVVTVVTRSFFFISSREWLLPHWAQRGLQYAPIAALSAVVVPEILMQQGLFISTWMDARWMAAFGHGRLFAFSFGIGLVSSGQWGGC